MEEEKNILLKEEKVINRDLVTELSHVFNKRGVNNNTLVGNGYLEKERLRLGHDVRDFSHIQKRLINTNPTDEGYNIVDFKFMRKVTMKVLNKCLDKVFPIKELRVYLSPKGGHLGNFQLISSKLCNKLCQVTTNIRIGSFRINQSNLKRILVSSRNCTTVTIDKSDLEIRSDFTMDLKRENKIDNLCFHMCNLSNYGNEDLPLESRYQLVFRLLRATLTSAMKDSLGIIRIRFKPFSIDQERLEQELGENRLSFGRSVLWKSVELEFK